MKLTTAAIVLCTIGSATAKKSKQGKMRGPKKGDGDDPFDVDIDIEFTGCDYELTFSFVHNAELLPLPTSPTDYAPGVNAPDSLPYLASRQFDYPFSDKIYEATGFASHSLDYQPCGHPPLDVFGGPHYDMHFYTDAMKVREERTCEQLPIFPICIPDPTAQTTASGRAFFNVANILGTATPANMPENFFCDFDHAVPANGGNHCWDYSTNPDDYASWVEPVLIMGSYDAKIAFWEPMTPLGFVTGPDDHHFSKTVEYQGQTIKTLPKEYSINYVESTGRTTITLKGERSFCDMSK